ncbi:hypothetical protein AB0G32_27520 [Streptomyces sp. NPDC023723]|uniref:hypothetical protein n=1 Tax=Streptomyces sp. NPDC023723 TaxID=3154323 RepID=UPI0034083A92
MTIEPVTELGTGGALRLPRARVVPLSAPPSSYPAAVERCLTGAGIAKSSARISASGNIGAAVGAENDHGRLAHRLEAPLGFAVSAAA